MFAHRTYLMLAVVCLSAVARGGEFSAIERFVTDDVVAVGYLDLGAVDPAAFVDLAAEMNLATPEQRQEAEPGIAMARGTIEGLRGLGVDTVYVLLRPSDVEHLGPTVVVPVADGKEPGPVKEMLSGFTRSGDLKKVRFAVDGQYLLAALTDEQIEMLKAAHGKRAEEVADAWKTLSDGDCGLVVFGSKDSRRVVREMFPKLPEPFGSVSGEMIADRVKWGGVKVSLPPEPGVKLHIETADASSAESLATACDAGLEMLRGLINSEPEAKRFLPLVDVLLPTVEGNTLALEIDNASDDLKLVKEVLTPPIEEAREQAWRNRRMNSFKNLALAFLNYENTKRQLPPAAFKSADGKPLLSWRVHLLPYLEEMELYKKFHLDEPWDSKHNFALIQQMPEVYADPALKQLAAEGRTTFVVPVGAETLFPPEGGVQIRDVTDGLSNTVLLVEVSPDKSVVWTKPDDWEADLADPWAALRREGRGSVVVGFGDGSVRVFDEESVPGEKLRKFLTRAGGEVVER